MIVHLLDVNVLIALLDPEHVHHDIAYTWLEQRGDAPWATCPLTENGVLRIMGRSSYPGSPGSPADIVPLLQSLLDLPTHEFWPDDLSLLDRRWVDPDKLLNANHLTDTYLLALAVKHGGSLATFDRRLSILAVPGGREALTVIP